MYDTLDEQMDIGRRMIQEHNQIVCLLGVGMGMEAGLPNMWSNDVAYYTENKYDYSPEELYTATFLNTRPALFYEFYKESFLKPDPQPTEGYYAISTLQQKGKIKGVITQSVWGLAHWAGIQDLVELHGNVHHNWCPKCKKTYSSEYMLHAKGVPLCEECQTTIRPGVILGGEQVRNDSITYAANLISGADMMLVLGTNMNNDMIKWALNYFTGDKILVISKNEHFSDNRANLTINEAVKEVLPKII